MASFTIRVAEILLLTCLLGQYILAAKLGTYNVDRNAKIFVSGLSSGGGMAMQFHIAFSKDVAGAGIFAGVPYSCGKGGLVSATNCMNSPGLVNVNTVITEINSQASSSKIDPVSNLGGSRVFIFHGKKDTTVYPAAATKIRDIYENFDAVIESNVDMEAVHGFPTNFYGAACGSSGALTQYINNCNYHGAFHALNYLYEGSLIEPTGTVPLNGQLLDYDQTEFGGTSMDNNGFIYVPSGCADNSKKCRFHISLHGCQQSRSTIQDIYATKTGYLEVAELNDIIVIFPQAKANVLLGNPNACWDWWSYTNANYLNKVGTQMNAIYEMLVRVAKCDGASTCFEEDNTEPPVPTTQATTTTTSSGKCQDNEVTFHPFPGLCQYYTMCACSTEVLLQCAPGLYFDPSINNCNFQQLVDCQESQFANELKSSPKFLTSKRKFH